ncbi:MAG TPA: hypothetical protein VF399_11445 [bacterium]
MSIYKSWEEYFNRLLRDIAAKYQGKVNEPKKVRLDEIFHYSDYSGTINAHYVIIVINQFVSLDQGITQISGSDDIEYLHLKIKTNSRLNFQLTKEDLSTKVAKFMHLESEFKTGNTKFDTKFLVKIRSEEDKTIISDSRLQELVYKLEPFVLLELKDGILHWAQTIIRGEQLRFSEVDKYLGYLLTLADMFTQHLRGNSD